MEIAVISDIHGNLLALQEVLADVDRAGVDRIFNLGDTLGGPLASALTADLLMQRRIPMIAGNHERQLLTLPPGKLSRSDACTASEINAAHRAWLASAPPTQWLSDEVFACHGTPSSDHTPVQAPCRNRQPPRTLRHRREIAPRLEHAAALHPLRRGTHGTHGRATWPPRLGYRAAHRPHDLTPQGVVVWVFYLPNLLYKK